MRSGPSLLCLLFAMGASCDALDPKDPEPVDTLYSECQQAADIGCDKYFACYTEEERAPLQGLLGTSAADCKVRARQTCEPSDQCPTGMFHGAEAKTCLQHYGAYTCEEFKKDVDGSSDAACKLMCS